MFAGHLGGILNVFNECRISSDLLSYSVIVPFFFVLVHKTEHVVLE